MAAERYSLAAPMAATADRRACAPARARRAPSRLVRAALGLRGRAPSGASGSPSGWREHGCAARVEQERAHGTYWRPMGLLSRRWRAAAGLSGRARPRARSRAAAPPRRSPTTSPAGAHVVPPPRCCPRARPGTSSREAGDRRTPRDTLVVRRPPRRGAHVGCSSPRARRAFVGRALPGLVERTDTSPPLMWLGHRRARCWSRLGRAHRRARRCAAPARVLALASRRAFADIGAARRWCPAPTTTSPASPSLLELARRLRERAGRRRARAAGLDRLARSRSWRGCAPSRGATSPRCPRERTHVRLLDTVGSPELVAARGRGDAADARLPARRSGSSSPLRGAGRRRARCAAACASATRPTR